MLSLFARYARASLFGALALMSSATAQSFNIDIGANVAFPLPTNAHAGSNEVAGQWNNVSGLLVGTQNLVDVLNVSTSVTIAQSGGTANLDSNNVGTLPGTDEERLLDDAQVIAASGTTTWTISGLANGPYRVSVFAWAPDNPVGTVTQVRVVGGALGPRNCGGAGFGSAYEFGTTHVADSVRVTSGVITIELSNVTGVGRCNGIQIQALPAGFGSVLRGPFDLTSITGRGDHVALGAFGDDYFVKGTGSGGTSELLYRISATSLTSTVVTGVPPCPLARDVAVRPCPGPVTRVVITTNGTQICRYEYVGDVLISCSSAFAATGALGITMAETQGGLPVSGEVVFYDDGTGTIQARDTATFGAPTLISPNTGFLWQGLAWDDTAQMLWGSAQFNAAGGTNDLLLFAEVDPRNGHLTGKAFQGQAGLGTSNVAGGCEIHIDALNPTLLSLATIHVNSTGADQLVVYDIGAAPRVPVNYCTAATSTIGCTATLSALGTPSISALSGFNVSASNVEGQKSGLFFYGLCGRKASPWGVGFLCVKAPFQRTSVQNSGGTLGLCDGLYLLDWLAYVSANPGSLGMPHGAGTIVDIQAWYRDSPAPKTSNMSDALEFVVVP